MAETSKNDFAWSELFAAYPVLETIRQTGRYEMDAATINRFREARLMAKFDHYINLPSLFRQHQLAILPISRSKYVIGRFDAYAPVTYDPTVKPVVFGPPSGIESLRHNELYSESLALHYAYLSGMIDDLVGEKTYLTVSGRMSSRQFSFHINDRVTGEPRPITVENSQCEIDGGYESANHLILIEAKNYSVDDFLIRQLYFPYRLWSGKLTKPVLPVFMTYSNDIFSFFVYQFTDPTDYNSLRIVKQKQYVVAPETIQFQDLVDVYHATPVTPEPEVPFPQADTFTRVIDLLGLLYETDLSRDAITENYQFDLRQTAYYTSAAIYLGLAERFIHPETKEVSYRLTETGRSVMHQDFKHKYLSLVRALFTHEVFHTVFARVMESSQVISKAEICNIMRNCQLYHLDPMSNTIERRAQTVLKWLEWVISLAAK